MATAKMDARSLRQGSLDVLALLGIALAVFLFVVFPHETVIVWQGEGFVHLGLQGEAIRRIQSATNGAELAAGWTTIFHRYPKVLFDAISVAAGLLSGSDGSIETQRFIMMRGQALAFAAMLIGLGLFIGRRFGFPIALVVTLILLSDQYLQVYAVFPIHQIVAHAIGWGAILLYLSFRLASDHFEPMLALPVGIVLGLAILTHYSAIELLFVFFCAEAALAALDRRFARSMFGYIVLLAGAASVLLGAEMIYHALRYLSTRAVAIPVSFSPIDGLVNATLKLYFDRTYVDSMAGMYPWDALIYLGVVGSPLLQPLILAGCFVAFRNGAWRRSDFGSPHMRLLTACVACVGFWVLVATPRHHAVARIYLYYYPALMILLAASLAQLLPALDRALAILSTKTAEGWRKFAVPVARVHSAAVLVAVVIFVVALPRTLTTKAAIRGSGAVDAFLAQSAYATSPVVHLGFTVDAVLKRPVSRLPVTKLCDIPDDALIYLQQAVYIPHFDRPAEEKAALAQLRRQVPLFQVTDYSGLSVYYYEFLLQQRWHDRSDPLSTTRSILAAKPAKAGFCPGPTG